VTYAVFITPAAEAEIRETFTYIHRDAPLNAQRWLTRLYEQIDTLELFPNRCPVAPDSEHMGQELRHLLFESHRIIFRVETEARIVRILGVRHASRRAMGEPTPGDGGEP
jgi:plasmid stabilization system protein ParE